MKTLKESPEIIVIFWSISLSLFFPIKFGYGIPSFYILLFALTSIS